MLRKRGRGITRITCIKYMEITGRVLKRWILRKRGGGRARMTCIKQGDNWKSAGELDIEKERKRWNKNETYLDPNRAAKNRHQWKEVIRMLYDQPSSQNT